MLLASGKRDEVEVSVGLMPRPCRGAAAEDSMRIISHYVHNLDRPFELQGSL